MAEGWLPTGAATALDALVAANPWFTLHVGAPGAAGTSNPATETTRKQLTWNATGSDGIVESSNSVSWTGIAGSQDPTHGTLRSASTAGTVGASGVITANAYVAGDTVTIAAGGVVVSVPLAT